MVKSGAKELTAFQQQCVDLVKQINKLKLACEANIVSILYKEPEKYQEADLKLDDFTNNIWRVYFEIFKSVVIDEGKNTIDEIICGTYLEAHERLKEVYEESGGWQTIQDAGSYVKSEAFDGYVQELHKWNALLELAKHGWLDKNRMSWYADASLDDIYNEFEAYINDIFVNATSDTKSYDITEGIDQTIEELDKGAIVGLPFYNMPLLTQKVNGLALGNMTFIAGLSGAGKSTFTRNVIVPSCIQNHERICCILNEEDLIRFQREMLILVANVVFDADMQKHVLRNGNFSDETKEILHKSAQWLKENTANHLITIVPLQRYTTKLAIKVIKKYAALGVKYFIIDTLKMDADSAGKQQWQELQNASIELFDTVKSANLDVSLTVTYQLAKSSANQRYYNMDCFGVSKNVIDVASTALAIRLINPDEYPGEDHELTVYRLEGKNGKTKIPVQLSPDKRYLIIFTVKSREGSSNDFQIVCEVDYSRNTVKEIGITNIMPDNFNG